MLKPYSGKETIVVRQLGLWEGPEHRGAFSAGKSNVPDGRKQKSRQCGKKS